jgi:glycosyltransferase involved in cell wall biosynthesis
VKIAFLTPSLSRSAGGIFEIERRLAQSLAQLPDTSIEVYGAEDKYTAADLAFWSPLKPKAYPYWGPSNFRYSPRLRRAFLNCEAEIAHLHALWMHTSVILSAWASRHGRSYVITANGMLEPWARRNSRVKKRIVSALYERRCLEGAACIQVNSQREAKSIRDFGLRNPSCIIPNGIDLPTGTGQKTELARRSSDKRKVMLYLGRLHAKKNLANLIRAWKQTLNSDPSAQEDWVLAIAGWDQAGYEAQLRQLTTDLQLLTSVIFLGPLFGADKDACYRTCDAFILPSLSEGLPMAVLEAWAYAKPVLMTPECNLPESFAVGAAVQIGTTPGEMTAGLKKLTEMSDSDRTAMGNCGRALVATRFSWPRIGEQMRSVYEWVLGGGATPESVRHD